MAKRQARNASSAVAAEWGPADAGPAPRDATALHAWVREHIGIDVARTPMIRGHHAPMEYLAWSFFEGAEGWPVSTNEPVIAARPRASDCVVWASRGSGKTLLGALASVLDLVFKPGVEVRIMGGSMDQSKRMYAHLRRLLSRPALAPMVKGAWTQTRVRLVNGSELELLSQSQASVRGTRVQKLRCDEVELFDPDVWEAAQLTTRSRTVRIDGVGEVLVRGGIECFSTMHLPHGLMARLVGECGAEGEALPRRRLFRWGVLDVLEVCGPEHACRGAAVEGVPEEAARAGDCVMWGECAGRAKARSAGGHVTVADASRMKRRVSEATWSAEMLCLRPRRSGAVLPEFEPLTHVVDEMPWESGAAAGPWQWVAGMDFGFRARTVVLLGAVDAAGVLWIVRERAVAEAVVEDHARAIRRGLAVGAESQTPGPGWAPDDGSAEPGPAWVGVDPAGRQRSDQTGVSGASVLESLGLRVRDAHRPLHEGLELVRARLKPADGRGVRLKIHRRCAVLIESLEKYHYPEDDPESTRPVKDGNDHAVDALRYLVQNLDRPKFSRAGSYVAR